MKIIINHVVITVFFISVISASNAGLIAESYTPYIHGGQALYETPVWQTFISKSSGTLDAINLKLWREGNQELNDITVSIYEMIPNWYSYLGATSVPANPIGTAVCNEADLISFDFSNQNITLQEHSSYFFTINTSISPPSTHDEYVAVGLMIDYWVVEGDPTRQLYDNGGVVHGKVEDFPYLMPQGIEDYQDLWFQVTLVPEPASLILLGLGSLLLRQKKK